MSFSDYIIRPALRQVRRFSRPEHDSEPEPTHSPSQRKRQERLAARGDAISESEEDSRLQDDHDASVSSTGSNPYSMIRIGASEAAQREDNPRHLETVAPQHRGAETSQQTSAGPSALDIPTSSTAYSQLPAESSDITGQAATGAMAIPAAEHLPEDDGMGPLRKQIQALQASDMLPAEKAQLMHQLLMQGFNEARSTAQPSHLSMPSSVVSFEQRQTPGPLESFKFWQMAVGEAAPEKFVLTEADVQQTFAPLKEDEEESEFRALGCEHYRRNVKLQCAKCEHWYTCRFCHDKEEDHVMIRKDTKYMLCMFCGTAQKAGESCTSCGESAAVYYCHLCKLWDNDTEKYIYHCHDCGICRLGRGLGKDFFHCKKCCACLAISIEEKHRCIERSLDCDCPICGDYMFNSPRPVCFMKCGHAMHRGCYNEYITLGYRCPICSKSLMNMGTQFRNLDAAIEAQPMPEKFQDTKAVVHCLDCFARTVTKYHWLGLKCAICLSYNTSQIRIVGAESDRLNAAADAPDRLLPESINAGLPGTMGPAEGPGPRDMRRRRHSSQAMQPSTESLGPRPHDIGAYVVQDRFARSVSPPSTAGPSGLMGLMGFSQTSMDDDEGDDDIIGLWRRVPRSIISNEDGEIEDEGDSGGETASSSGDEDEAYEEDEEDEEEPFSLFGHR